MSDPVAQRGSALSDLLIVLVLTALAAVVIGVDLDVTPLRVGLTLPLVLVLPGYAVVSALFPDAPRPVDATEAGRVRVSVLERVLFGVLVSVALVPLVAYGVYFSPYALAVEPLVVAVGGLTVAFVAIALLRRLGRNPADRFRVSPSSVGWIRRTFGVTPPRDRGGADVAPTNPLFTIWIALGLLVFLAAVGFALAAAPAEDPYTEFSLLMEGEDDELVGEGYPTDPGEVVGETVHLRVDNQEGEAAAYTVVVAYQAIDGDGDVAGSRTVDTLSLQALSGERASAPYAIEEGLGDGENRIAFLLYAGEPPAQPSVATAYRAAYLDFSE